MGKPFDITESQISHQNRGKNNVLFSTSKFADNRCEATLKILTPLMKILFILQNEQHIKGAAFSFHSVDVFSVSFDSLCSTPLGD